MASPSENNVDRTTWRGVFPAVPTPFNGSVIDVDAFTKHLAALQQSNVTGVVVAGTTGESLALSNDERLLLLQTTKATIPKKRLICGIAAAALPEALSQARAAESAESDALLVLPPYYVKSDPKALLTFFQDILKATNLPIILYNNPSRLGFQLSVDLIVTLAQNNQVVSLKEADPDLDRVADLKKQCPDLPLLGGEDNLFPAFLAMGGDGLISVGANACPRLYTDLQNAWERNDLAAFKDLLPTLHTFHAAFQQAPNPAVIKYILSHLGFGEETLRVPLSTLADEQKRLCQRMLPQDFCLKSA